MKKIFPTILFLFIIITFLTIPTLSNKKSIRTNIEMQKQSIPMQKLYLLNKDHYLVQVEVFLPGEDIVKETIEYLKEGEKESGWNGYIPKEVKINNYSIKGETLEINFSNEIKKLDKKYIPGMIYSLKGINKINTVKVFIEGEEIDTDLSINLDSEITNRRDLDKVVIFYFDNKKENHYVPVTKYQNSQEEKMEGIMKELKDNVPPHLMNYISNQLELLSYQEEKDVMILDFNDALLNDSQHKNENMKEIAATIFENYNVSLVIFNVDGNFEEMVTK